MNIITFILDTILPPDPQIRAIERMSPHEFKEHAGNLSPTDMTQGVVSLFSYRNKMVKAALIELKTYKNDAIASLLGTLMYEFLAPQAHEHPLLIPVPMTKKALRKRGWNQCEMLVQAIHKKDAQSIFEVRTDILVKIRENEDQVGKGRKERFDNLRGCFNVRDEKTVNNRNVIVLDDIVTTGATLEEARRALMAAGARTVILTSVAH